MWTSQLRAFSARAVVERPAFSTLVLVAGRLYWRGAYCYGVSSVSLFNPLARPAALLHYDVTLSPPVLWSGCQSQPILSMAARSGTSDLYLVWGGSVWYYDLSGTASVYIAPPICGSLSSASRAPLLPPL